MPVLYSLCFDWGQLTLLKELKIQVEMGVSYIQFRGLTQILHQQERVKDIEVSIHYLDCSTSNSLRALPLPSSLCFSWALNWRASSPSPEGEVSLKLTNLGILGGFTWISYRRRGLLRSWVVLKKKKKDNSLKLRVTCAKLYVSKSGPNT